MTFSYLKTDNIPDMENDKKEKVRIRKVECNKGQSYELYFLWNILNDLYSYYDLLQEGVFIWLKHLGVSPWGPMPLNTYLNF